MTKLRVLIIISNVLFLTTCTPDTTPMDCELTTSENPTSETESTDATPSETTSTAMTTDSSNSTMCSDSDTIDKSHPTFTETTTVATTTESGSNMCSDSDTTNKYYSSETANVVTTTDLDLTECSDSDILNPNPLQSKTTSEVTSTDPDANMCSDSDTTNKPHSISTEITTTTDSDSDICSDIDEINNTHSSVTTTHLTTKPAKALKTESTTTTEPKPQITKYPSNVTTGSLNKATTISMSRSEMTPKASVTSKPEYTTVKATHETSAPLCPEDVFEPFKEGLWEFTFKYFHELRRQNSKDGALISSPIASLYPTGMFICFSYDRTYDELLRAFRIKNCDQFLCVIKRIDQYLLENNDAINLSVFGTYYFFSTQYFITKQFKEASNDLILGQTLNIDYGNNLGAVKEINNAVQKYSNITNFLNGFTDFIGSSTQLLLGDAFSFTKKFRYGFDPKDIISAPFYISYFRSITTQYYTTTMDLKYMESKSLKAQFTLVPLKGSYSMLIALPDHVKGLHSLILRLGHNKMISSVLDNMQLTSVFLKIPTLGNITTTLDAKKIIKDILPIHSIYHERTAKLVDVVVKNKPVAVTEHIQKISMTTDFTGSTIPKQKEKNLPYAEVFCHHPYAYVIILNGFPIFIGATLRVDN